MGLNPQTTTTSGSSGATSSSKDSTNQDPPENCTDLARRPSVSARDVSLTSSSVHAEHKTFGPCRIEYALTRDEDSHPREQIYAIQEAQCTRPRVISSDPALTHRSPTTSPLQEKTTSPAPPARRRHRQPTPSPSSLVSAPMVRIDHPRKPWRPKQTPVAPSHAVEIRDAKRHGLRRGPSSLGVERSRAVLVVRTYLVFSERCGDSGGGEDEPCGVVDAFCCTDRIRAA